MSRNQKHASPIEKVWLQQQFDRLHDENLLILKRINEIQTVISPELERQIRRAGWLARSADRKVPDQTTKRR